MRSFILSILAALAFGIFCSATPTPSGFAADYSPRAGISARDETKTMSTILSGATIAVGPISDKMSERLFTYTSSCRLLLTYGLIQWRVNLTQMQCVSLSSSLGYPSWV